MIFLIALVSGQDAGELRVDSINFFTWDETASKWKPNEEYNCIEFSYSKDYRVTEFLKYNKVNNSGEPLERWKEERVISEDGGEVQTTCWIFDSNQNNWIQTLRIFQKFDDPRLLAEKIWEIWDSTNSGWINSMRITQEYNDISILENQYIAQWNETNGWDTIFRVVLSPQNDQQKVLYKKYNRDLISGKWDLNGWSTQKFDADGEKIELVNYMLNPLNDSLILQSREMSSFDPISSVSEKVQSTWSESLQLWIDQWKIVHKNNKEAHKEETVIYKWIPDQNEVIPHSTLFGKRGSWFGLIQSPGYEEVKSEDGFWQKELKKITWLQPAVDTVHFKDSLFLRALIEEGIDANQDQVISYSEAENVVYLDIGGDTIFDGINYVIQDRCKW